MNETSIPSLIFLETRYIWKMVAWCLIHNYYLSSSNSKSLPACNAIFSHFGGCHHQRHFITMGSVDKPRLSGLYWTPLFIFKQHVFLTEGSSMWVLIWQSKTHGSQSVLLPEFCMAHLNTWTIIYPNHSGVLAYLFNPCTAVSLLIMYSMM